MNKKTIRYKKNIEKFLNYVIEDLDWNTLIPAARTIRDYFQNDPIGKKQDLHKYIDYENVLVHTPESYVALLAKAISIASPDELVIATAKKIEKIGIRDNLEVYKIFGTPNKYYIFCKLIREEEKIKAIRLANRIFPNEYQPYNICAFVGADWRFFTNVFKSSIGNIKKIY